MDYETLLVEKSEGIMTVTLNRPEKLNAINSQLISDLVHLCGELRSDLSTRFVILTGAGRAFSSGADISGMGDRFRDDPERPGYVNARLAQFLGHDMMRGLENLEQIAIAAIHGYCLGGGLAMVLACDFRIASQNALLGLPEANIGIFFTWGSTPRLTRLVGPSKAKELIMTCENISADEALRWGLVDKVVPDGQLMESAHAFIEKIANSGPMAVRMTKKIVNAATASAFGDLFLCEPELVERITLSGEMEEGLKAFQEKRKPKFT